MVHSMIRIAEEENFGEELRCAAIQLLKDLDENNIAVINKLSDMDAKRILKVSMDMLSCIEDHPHWFEINEKESISAGLSPSFKLGKFLLNWLSIKSNGGLVVPMAIEFLKTTYAASEDWRKRHARMIAIGDFLDGQQNDVVKCFVELEKLVSESLNDGHHRVLWAAMNAVQCLSKIIPEEKYHYHMKFFSKLFLVVRSNCCPQVQIKAVQAIHSLMKICCLDKMVSFGEEIVIAMLELLKNDKKEIQEEAVQTLKSIAALIPTHFFKYYDMTMESLKAILFHDYSKPKLLLRAKSLEFMSSILLRYEFAHFTGDDVVQFVSSLILLEKQLSSTDYLVRNHMFKALDQFCRFLGVDAIRYIHNFMPMLLRSAELDIELKDNMLTDDSCSAESVRVQALNILSYCAVRSWKLFSPHIGRASKIFVNCLACSIIGVRKASVPGDQRDLPVILVQSLVEALHKETDDTVSMSMLKTLPTCIQQISGSVFTNELIKKIADEINRILSTWCHKFIERDSTQEAGNPRTSEGGRGDLPDEEIIQGAKVLITATVEILKGRLLPHIDDILSNVAKLWGPDVPDRVKPIAVSIFNVVGLHFPDKLQRFYPTYTYELFKASDKSLHALQETARGIGMCAMSEASNFQTIVNAAISKLYSLIEHGRSIEGEESGDGKLLSDMAVSALGNICEFQREHIDGPEVIQNWLNFLPIKNDAEEARKVHAQLSKLEDADVLGPNQGNLPKIISILKAILLLSEELVTEETFSEITEFLDEHDGEFL
ncbi:hypothetical protein RIF29_13848 [Crotalaria pallida]|uniref:Uncharacterized protein n=1 Tax=Crotalaria pallida TaxID=3830 RepID=A0AAN9FJ04_CROPI